VGERCNTAALGWIGRNEGSLDAQRGFPLGYKCRVGRLDEFFRQRLTLPSLAARLLSGRRHGSPTLEDRLFDSDRNLDPFDATME
jgi:hypothetical protein